MSFCFYFPRHTFVTADLQLPIIFKTLAVLLEAREGDEDLEGVVRLARGDRAAQEDERVAPPVEEPRITRDHGLHSAEAWLGEF